MQGQRVRCPDCGAAIVWLDGPRGLVPLEARPSEAFEVVQSDDVTATYKVATVHHQHRCPNPRRGLGTPGRRRLGPTG